MVRTTLRGALATTMAAGVLVAVSPLSASATTPAPAPLNWSPTVKTINRSVYAPFGLDYARARLYVADGGTGRVSVVRKSGLTTLATGPSAKTGGDVAGVSVNRYGDVAFTSTNYGKAAALNVLKHGTTTAKVLASALDYEKAHNPDGGVTYGIDHPTQCQQDALAGIGGAKYTGQVDSHPYAVASFGDSWIVADAGGNDLIKVGKDGKVSTVAVLPRQPLKITESVFAAIQAELKLPDSARCLIGAVYNFEPVPTDVELGRDGWLYVTLLPGGPENPALGARGSVYRVGARSGHAVKVAGGFLGATNLALDNRGHIFVAELFAGKVSVISPGGRVRTYVRLPHALSLTWGDGTLYAGTMAPMDDKGNPTGPGSLVAIR